MTMDLSLVFVFTLFFKSSLTVKCYKCDPDSPVDIRKRYCENFDNSDGYLEMCPDSTVCYKRVTSHEFGHGRSPTIAVERGCAPQTLSGDQVKTKQGNWIKIRRIYESYEDGCLEDISDEGRIPKTIECFCHGDYCNKGFKRKPLNPFILLIIIVFTIIMSYRL